MLPYREKYSPLSPPYSARSYKPCWGRECPPIQIVQTAKSSIQENQHVLWGHQWIPLKWSSNHGRCKLFYPQSALQNCNGEPSHNLCTQFAVLRPTWQSSAGQHSVITTVTLCCTNTGNLSIDIEVPQYQQLRALQLHRRVIAK